VKYPFLSSASIWEGQMVVVCRILELSCHPFEGFSTVSSAVSLADGQGKVCVICSESLFRVSHSVMGQAEIQGGGEFGG
jgi:hypothetical protein